jgi:hypothetical protein
MTTVEAARAVTALAAFTAVGLGWLAAGHASGSTVLFVLGVVLCAVHLYLGYFLIWVPFLWVRYFRKQGVPGEPYIPLLGNLGEMKKFQDESTDFIGYECELHRRHGPVCFFCKGPEFRLYFHDTDVLLEMSNVQNVLGKLPVAKSASALTLLQESFFMAKFESWRRQRKLYNAAFHHSKLGK